jgi:hypothetical protein
MLSALILAFDIDQDRDRVDKIPESGWDQALGKLD